MFGSRPSATWPGNIQFDEHAHTTVACCARRAQVTRDCGCDRPARGDGDAVCSENDSRGRDRGQCATNRRHQSSPVHQQHRPVIVDLDGMRIAGHGRDYCETRGFDWEKTSGDRRFQRATYRAVERSA